MFFRCTSVKKKYWIFMWVSCIWSDQEDFKITDTKDADWLIVRCNEGFDGGLPLASFELEIFGEENDDHINTIYLNRTTRSSFGPVFEVSGLEPGRNYRLLIYAVNAKGRSDPVILEPVTLKGVAMYTTGKFLLILTFKFHYEWHFSTLLTYVSVYHTSYWLKLLLELM